MKYVENEGHLLLREMNHEDQLAIFEAFKTGDAEYLTVCGWKKADALRMNNALRTKPVPDSIDWDHVSPEYNAMARDEGMSTPYLYKHKPIKTATDWQAPYNISASSFASLVVGNVPWDQSLVIRPGYVEKGDE